MKARLLKQRTISMFTCMLAQRVPYADPPTPRPPLHSWRAIPSPTNKKHFSTHMPLRGVVLAFARGGQWALPAQFPVFISICWIFVFNMTEVVFASYSREKNWRWVDLALKFVRIEYANIFMLICTFYWEKYFLSSVVTHQVVVQWVSNAHLLNIWDHQPAALTQL